MLHLLTVYYARQEADESVQALVKKVIERTRFSEFQQALEKKAEAGRNVLCRNLDAFAGLLLACAIGHNFFWQELQDFLHKATSDGSDSIIVPRKHRIEYTKEELEWLLQFALFRSKLDSCRPQFPSKVCRSSTSIVQAYSRL